MPRRPRVEQAGFHHVINRGVARGAIFLDEDDYRAFLEILEVSKERYHFTIHSLCLMGNHYHLLIETKHDNLSLIARQINSKYAQYFNRKQNRVGPLWQGRFKNWFVYDDNYLLVLFKYIEQNPIKAKITQKIGQYRWSSSTFLLDGEYLELIEGSKLFDEDIFSTLNSNLTSSEIEKLNIFQSAKYKHDDKDQELIRLKQYSLQEHFVDVKNITERNKSIGRAIVDGYKQSEIADYLGLSRTTVSKNSRLKNTSLNSSSN
ncbi:MAG: transposase [Epsilonproteobacteria bacterium]|nr:transposase [Campylobacterota bacterium]